ncbi:gastrula zinc finger protein XlCGF8.2DB-like [Pimephales promelas]|nr:gastrula zinc finger protein XlCGF8.2DB-like [Pimephales promelas]
MAFIKEESEDIKIEEAFIVKHEETEEQTDLMAPKEESQELNNMQVKDENHDLTIGEKSTPTEMTCSKKGAQKTKSNSDFTCSHCGRSFNHKRNFEVHVRTHTGEKPYTCQQCGKSFTQKQNLKVHMRIHNGEKPYTCQQCGNSYAYKGNLNAHVRLHTGEKPYTCNYCGKCFTQNGNLEVHMRIHTGEKPFKCPHWIGLLGSLPSTAARSTMHRFLMVPPAGVEPTVGRPHVAPSGSAWPGPKGAGPASRRWAPAAPCRATSQSQFFLAT